MIYWGVLTIFTNVVNSCLGTWWLGRAVVKAVVMVIVCSQHQRPKNKNPSFTIQYRKNLFLHIFYAIFIYTMMWHLSNFFFFLSSLMVVGCMDTMSVCKKKLCIRRVRVAILFNVLKLIMSWERGWPVKIRAKKFPSSEMDGGQFSITRYSHSQ